MKHWTTCISYAVEVVAINGGWVEPADDAVSWYTIVNYGKEAFTSEVYAEETTITGGADAKTTG